MSTTTSTIVDYLLIEYNWVLGLIAKDHFVIDKDLIAMNKAQIVVDVDVVYLTIIRDGHITMNNDHIAIHKDVKTKMSWKILILIWTLNQIVMAFGFLTPIWWYEAMGMQSLLMTTLFLWFGRPNTCKKLYEFNCYPGGILRPCRSCGCLRPHTKVHLQNSGRILAE